MKRLLVVAVLLVTAVFALSGCEAARYEQEELDQITQAGMEMMRTWLDENMPEAQIENCEALRLRSFDHTLYLSDYADGTIVYKGEKIPFAIHTVTGQVYFDHRQQEWDRAVRTYLCEIAGISPETEEVAFQCAYMAPLCIHDPEKREIWAMIIWIWEFRRKCRI